MGEVEGMRGRHKASKCGDETRVSVRRRVSAGRRRVGVRRRVSARR